MAGKFSLEATIKAADRLSRPIARMSTNMGSFIRRTERGFQRMKRQAKDFKASLGPIGAIAQKTALAGAAVGAAGALVGKHIIDVGSSFEQAMADISAVSGATGKDMDRLTGKARELGKTTQFTGTEVASAMEAMVKAGFSVDDTLAGVGGILSAAAADGATIEDTAAGIMASMKGLGLGPEKMQLFADQMAMAGDSTSASIGSLTESMAKFGPVARQLGVPVESSIAQLALLQDAGLDASSAGTALASTYSKLAAPIGATKKALKDLGIEVKDAHGNMKPPDALMADIIKATDGIQGNVGKMAAITNLVGLESQKALLNIAAAAGSGKLEELTTSLEGASGYAEKVAAKRMNSFKGDVKLLGSAVDALSEKLYSAEKGPLRDFVQGITKWVNANEGLITSGVNDFMEKALPLIEKVGRAFGGEFMSTVETSAKALGQFFEAPGAKEGEQWSKTLENLAGNLGKIAGAALIVTGIFAGLAGGMLLVVNTIVSAVIGAFEGFVEFVGSRLFAVVDWWDDLGAKIRQKGKSFWEIAKDVGKHVVKGLWNGIKALASMPLDAITEIGGSIWKAMKKSLGLGSPSKFAERDGKFTVQGLTKGMLSELPAVEKASRKMAEMALPDIGRAAAFDPIVIPVRFQVEPMKGPEFGSQVAPLAAPQVIDRHSPEAFAEAMHSRSETVDRSEVTIKDQTGRAEVTRKPKRGGLRVQQSGGL